MVDLNSSPKNHRIVYDKEQDSLQTLDTSKFKKTDTGQDLLQEAQINASAPILAAKFPAFGPLAKSSLEQITADQLHAETVKAQKKSALADKKKVETARPKLHLEPELPAQVRPANSVAKQPASSSRRISKDLTAAPASQKTAKPKK
jgi:hypothetical protein